MTLKQIAEVTGFNKITELKRSEQLKCVMIQPSSYAWKKKDASHMAKGMSTNLKRYGIVMKAFNFKSKKPKGKNGWISNVLTIIAKWDNK